MMEIENLACKYHQPTKCIMSVPSYKYKTRLLLLRLEPRQRRYLDAAFSSGMTGDPVPASDLGGPQYIAAPEVDEFTCEIATTAKLAEHCAHCAAPRRSDREGGSLVLLQ